MPPMPKRSDQRRRRNIVEGLTKAQGAAAVIVPRAKSTWHPIARRWFASLKASGQAQFYEQSDWGQAVVAAEILSAAWDGNRPTASLLKLWADASTELLTTEGARRRVRIELQRAPTGPDPQTEAEADIHDILRAVASA